MTCRDRRFSIRFETGLRGWCRQHYEWHLTFILDCSHFLIRVVNGKDRAVIIVIRVNMKLWVTIGIAEYLVWRLQWSVEHRVSLMGVFDADLVAIPSIDIDSVLRVYIFAACFLHVAWTKTFIYFVFLPVIEVIVEHSYTIASFYCACPVSYRLTSLLTVVDICD